MRLSLKRILIMIPAMMALMVSVMLLMPSPIDPAAWDSPSAPAETGVFEPNDLLADAELLAKGALRQPEDIAFDQAGRLYTGTKDGYIHRIRFAEDGRVEKIEKFAETGGYPLGLAFAPDGSLIAAVKGKGLTEVQADGTVRLFADQVAGTPITYANEVAISKNGIIYFTDSSEAFDTGWPYDILEARPHGRLLAYDPASKITRTVLDELYFANGLALSPEEDYLLIAETPKYRILRLWLKGPLAHTVEPFADNLPLLPDNLFLDQDGDIWVGGSKRIAAIDTLQPRPYWKKQIAKLPYALLKRVPTMNRYGLAVRLNAEGQVTETLHDRQGDVYGVSSVVRQGDTLYLGTLFGDSVARLEID